MDKRKTWSSSSSAGSTPNWAALTPPQSPEASPRLGRWPHAAAASWAAVPGTPASPRYSPPFAAPVAYSPAPPSFPHTHAQQQQQQQMYTHPNYSQNPQAYAPPAPRASFPRQQQTFNPPPQSFNPPPRDHPQSFQPAPASWNADSSFIPPRDVTPPTVEAGWGTSARPQARSGPPMQPQPQKQQLSRKPSWGPHAWESIGASPLTVPPPKPLQQHQQQHQQLQQQQQQQQQRRSQNPPHLRKSKSFSVIRPPPSDAIVARGRVGRRPTPPVQGAIAEETTAESPAAASDNWRARGTPATRSSGSIESAERWIKVDRAQKAGKQTPHRDEDACTTSSRDASKEAVKDTSKDDDAIATLTKDKEASATTRKETPKEAAKEMLKEETKESPKEAAKETPKEASKDTFNDAKSTYRVTLHNLGPSTRLHDVIHLIQGYSSVLTVCLKSDPAYIDFSSAAEHTRFKAATRGGDVKAREEDVEEEEVEVEEVLVDLVTGEDGLPRLAVDE